MIRKFLISAIALVLLAGCAGGYEKSPFELGRMAPQAAAIAIAGKTVRTYSADASYYLPNSPPVNITGHGTQIEYFAPNGRAYLWYHGNRRPVPSFWKIERLPDPDTPENRLCFKYPRASYNPSTDSHGGHWECRSLAGFAVKVLDTADGDIFDLSSGRLPFVMSKILYEFNELLALSNRRLLPEKSKP